MPGGRLAPVRPPNGSHDKLRGHGWHRYGRAARRLLTCATRERCAKIAAGVTPVFLGFRQPARPADRSRAAPASS
jgi:hypothetical protein